MSGAPGSRDRTVVLGLGNILNRDEGLGVHALGALAERLGEHADAELVDGGVLGLSLLPLVEGCARLLILDAVDAGRASGTCVELGREQIRLFSGVKLSEHQVSFQEVLGLAAFRGTLPGSLHLIGVQPADTSIGLGLSPIVGPCVAEVVERSIAVLRRWGAFLEPEAVGRA